MLISILNIFGVIIPLILTLQQYVSTRSTLLSSPGSILSLITLWGAAWALPFYIPPGLVALSLGGEHHAALVANIFDAFGFFAGAVFSFYSMKLGTNSQWTPVFLCCAITNALCLMLMNVSMKFMK